MADLKIVSQLLAAVGVVYGRSHCTLPPWRGEPGEEMGWPYGCHVPTELLFAMLGGRPSQGAPGARLAAILQRRHPLLWAEAKRQVWEG